MTNKEKIEKAIKKLVGNEYTIGCYDPMMEQLKGKNLLKVAENVDCDYTDVKVCIDRKRYIVEISTVDNEIDFNVLSKNEYIHSYGQEQYDNINDF